MKKAADWEWSNQRLTPHSVSMCAQGSIVARTSTSFFGVLVGPTSGMGSKTDLGSSPCNYAIMQLCKALILGSEESMHTFQNFVKMSGIRVVVMSPIGSHAIHIAI